MIETDETPPQSPRGRRGSETRQRNATLSLRLTDDEAAQMSAAADRAGLTVGGYVRTLALGSLGLRAARRPVVDRQQLTPGPRRNRPARLERQSAGEGLQHRRLDAGGDGTGGGAGAHPGDA